jgi:hypothetical protein
MLGRTSTTDNLKERAVSASELAVQLAQDPKFRKKLLSALRHGSRAGLRTRRQLGISGAITRLSTDKTLIDELRRASADLRRAVTRAESKRQSHRLRNMTILVVGVGSVAAAAQIRRMLSGRNGSRPQSLEELSKEELYERAQQADIQGRSEMSKDELVAALRRN